MTWLITDIDGTITDAHGRLHLPAIQEIQLLEKAGVQVGLISGRPYPMVRLLGEYLGLCGPLIAENGGAVFFHGRQLILGSRKTAELTVHELNSLISLKPAWDNQYRVTDYALEGDIDVRNLKQLIEEKGIEVELQASSIMVHLAEKGVTKRTGLEYCLGMEGLKPTEVVVAGDSDSDLSLFEGFPMSIAPANSTELIGRLAQFHAELSFGEGFCQGIDYFRRIGRLPYMT